MTIQTTDHLFVTSAREDNNGCVQCGRPASEHHPQTTETWHLKDQPLTEFQIKSVMPEFGDYGEKVVGNATLWYLCEMALQYLEVRGKLENVRI